MKITIAGGKGHELKKISKLIKSVNPTAEITGITHTDVTKPKNYRKRFLVRHLQKFLSIRVNQIAYFFTNGRLSFLVTTDNKRYILDYTMDQLEALNNPEQFFRVNRSYIISFDAVKQAEDYHGNRLIIDVQPASFEKLIVSRERVADFKQWLGK